MRRPTDRTLFLAAGGFAAAALVFAVALARALTLEPTPIDDGAGAVLRPPGEPSSASADAAREEGDHAVERARANEPGLAPEDEATTRPPTAGLPEVDGAPAAERALTLEALSLAVDNDPFQPDRRRPPEPYRMPGDFVDEPEAAPPPPPPPFRLLGTAAMEGGGLAVMQVEDALPRVLEVGESLMGYTLAEVAGDAATLMGDGRTLTLTVAQAEARPEPERPQRGRSRGNGDDDDDDDRARAQSERQEVLQRTLERQMRGLEGSAIEQLRRLMQQRGEGNPRIQFDNGRVIIRPRVGPDTMIELVQRRPPGG